VNLKEAQENRLELGSFQKTEKIPLDQVVEMLPGQTIAEKKGIEALHLVA